MWRRILLILLLPGLAAAGPAPWPEADSTGGVPGLSGSTGTEETINALLGVQEFEYLRTANGYVDYYVSADAGGIADEGDDTAAGTSWATAWQSLCRVDIAIELSPVPTRIWFDSHDANDVWDDLDTELDCLNHTGAYYDANDPTGSLYDLDDLNWDGSIGSPNPSLVSPQYMPVLVILSSDPASPANLDFRNLLSTASIDRDQEDCTPNGGSTGQVTECDNDNDGLMFCPYSKDGDYHCAASNISLNHYPSAPEGANRGSKTKDVFAGNWVTVNIKDVHIIGGQQVNYSSIHLGGWDVHINPEIAWFDGTDFDSTCAGSDCVNSGSTNVYDEYPLIQNCMSGGGTCTGSGLCTGTTNQPWAGCQATTGDYSTVGSMIGGNEGGTILISNQTYDYKHENGSTEFYQVPFAAVGQFYFGLLGPMTITSTATDKTNMAFVNHGAWTDAADTDTVSSGNEMWIVGANITGTWGDSTDDYPVMRFYEGTTGGLSTEITMRTYMRDVKIDDSNGDLFWMPQLDTNHNGFTHELTLSCVSVEDWDGNAFYWPGTNSGTGVIDLEINDVEITNGVGTNISNFGGTTLDTTWLNAGLEWSNTSDGITCQGSDDDCVTTTTGGDDPVRRASTNKTLSARPQCGKTLEMRFPTVSGVQGRIPGWVFGPNTPSITGFDFVAGAGE